jgi:hypothetical protein
MQAINHNAKNNVRISIRQSLKVLLGGNCSAVENQFAPVLIAACAYPTGATA